MPDLTGRVEVCLSVLHPGRSAEWYAALLGMERRYEHRPSDGGPDYFCLIEPASQFVLCLVGHHDNPGGPFDETRTGLDHLEFMVEQRSDLDDWARRLDQLGIDHSGVKAPEHTANTMLTFRDPDNIQLEFFWRAPEPLLP